jgi:signal transduction histidine kinase/CHASE2 domain-containing sensor protein
MGAAGQSGHTKIFSVKKAIICLVALGFVLLIEYAGFFIGTNNYFYDLSFRIRGSIPPSKDVVIIAIDDKSLERLGRWPLSRRYYATLIDKIADAKVIAFDIIMAEPTDDDLLIAGAIRRKNAVLPVLIDENRDILHPLPLFSGVLTGHVHVEQDIDGIVRGVYHTLHLSGRRLHSLSSVVFGLATNRIFPHSTEKRYTVGNDILQYDHMYINYCGNPGSIATASFADVINGVYPTSYFKDKIVFVGVTALGAGDRILTPFSKDRRGMAGVEGQANIYNTLITGSAINTVPKILRWLMVISVAAFSMFCFLRLTEQRAAFLALFELLAIAVVTYLLFSFFNIWLVPSAFFVTIFLMFVLAYIFRFNDAVVLLDKAYTALVPRLRWGYEKNGNEHIREGIFGFFTERGVRMKSQILNDVSTQLGFEKELTDRALLSDIHGVLIFGPDKRNMLINDLAQGLLRENNIEMASSEIFVKSLAGFTMDKMDPEVVLEGLSSAKDGLSFTVSLERPSKTFYKVDASCFEIDDGSYRLFILSDVTRIKELEMLKGHIISVVSHELKTPLTSIQGFSEILADKLEGKMKNFAEIIHRESERLARFLNMFLDITRIEEGRQPIKMASVNLNNVIREVALALKPIGDKSSITINTDIPEKTDDIKIDIDLTKQCIYNLVENAIKYSPPDMDVTIRLKDEKDTIVVDIIDHGYGIKQEDIKKVFEKFYRSSSDKTKNIKGSGLGLTFVKEAVEAQGGRLSFVSVYGEGSTFSITFPKNR